MIFKTPEVMVSVDWIWYDLWVGAYVDRKKHRLFICPLPTVVLCVQPTLHGRLAGFLNTRSAEERGLRREAMVGYARMAWRYRMRPSPRAMRMSAVDYARQELRRHEMRRREGLNK